MTLALDECGVFALEREIDDGGSDGLVFAADDLARDAHTIRHDFGAFANVLTGACEGFADAPDRRVATGEPNCCGGHVTILF